MLFHLRDMIKEAFFRIGYKLGSLIGYIGGTSLGNGFEKGLSKRIEESVKRFTDNNNFEDVIRASLDRIVDDFVMDSVHNPEVDMAIHDITHSFDFTENDGWVENVDHEVQNIIDNIEANQP